MLWFTVWTVLVLATLAGALWLGRDLWRKGKALLAEVQRAGDLVSAMADRADELTAAAEGRPPTHDLLTDPATHHDHLAGLRAARDLRRAERRLRHVSSFARWRAYTR